MPALKGDATPMWLRMTKTRTSIRGQPLLNGRPAGATTRVVEWSVLSRPLSHALLAPDADALAQG
jgi:hypothetical protein